LPQLKGPVKRNAGIALSILLFSLFLFTAVGQLTAQDRIPRPEFETNYQLPELTTPQPRALALEYLDIAVLTGTLTMASLIALKWRSRRAMFLLMIFSLVYFGFYRKGCICPVASVQNVALAAFNPAYSIPLKAIAYFALPLVFAIFFGRTFCAGVCPIGAIQDIFVLWPVRVPEWLERALGMLPYIHLSLAVLFSATNADFIVCRFHPFLGFFRFAAGFNLMTFGASFLITGMFVARPYCRYLCPYVVLLKWMSRFSRWHLTITPDECIKCRLCEDSCPFGAIRTPTTDIVPESRTAGIRRLMILLVLLPVLTFAGGWAWSKLHDPFSHMHRSVRLAEQVRREDLGISMETTLESEAFRKTGTPPADLYEEAFEVKRQYLTGGWWSGGFLGLVFGIALIDLSIRRKREDYTPDRASCFSCGRCLSFCPKEHFRRSAIKSWLGNVLRR
jgi:polyferredoxin